MFNKLVVITGSNTGIGFETAVDLASRGAKVILACRDEKRGTTARDQIIKSTGNQNITFKPLDLASFKSVRAFADDIMKSESRLDVLINNAGTGNVGNFLTEDHLPFEAQVNHFSPFLLTLILLPLLKSSAPSRIVNVSSVMHKIGKIDLGQFDKQAKTVLSRLRVYSDTKLANILFTRRLSQILSGTGVTVNCLHPGAVNTDIFRNKDVVTKFLIRLFFKTATEGAQTSVHLAVSQKLEDTTGKYFCDCREVEPASRARDDATADKLWKLSEEVVSYQKKVE
ncbi:putative RDH13 [Operophtera brumata]|uniref:Putative RDH13 n=1 Tax=Operophtera brumata TaxID=104452 RepID=A0A0L7L5N4_OPEBR|nr:putative RDH13 [Operophtera brumata]